MRLYRGNMRMLRLGLLLSLVSTAIFIPTFASATSSSEQIATAVSKGVTYLRSLQTNSGSFDGGTNGEWALSALASAGVAAANVRVPEGETNARSYYWKLVGNETATKWPPEMTEPGGSPEIQGPVVTYSAAGLNAYAAGIEPGSASKTRDLIAALFMYYTPSAPGYYGGSHDFYQSALALLALAGMRSKSGTERMPSVLLEQSIHVMEENQHNDGGWTFEYVAGSASAKAEPSEVDVTGLVMGALCEAGLSQTSAPIEKAKALLKSRLVSATGAFTSEAGVETASTARAVDGLDTCGINPQDSEYTTTAGKTPVDFLLSQQLSSGGFKNLPEETTANEYASEEAVHALGGGGLAVAPPDPTEGAEYRWIGAETFSTGKAKSPVALVVNNDTSTLKVCSVEVGPEETTATIEAILEAADKESTPKECVTSFKKESSKSSAPITQINGYPSTPSALWDVSVNGGTEEQAKASKRIHLGETIYLKLT